MSKTVKITGVLCDWERNGYHDSDFYVSHWDSETESVKVTLYGTTRGAMCAPELVWATDEEILKAREAREPGIAARLVDEETQRIMKPYLHKGDKVATKVAFTWIDRKNGDLETKVEQGKIGNVFWTGHFGRFYRNGYNKPSYKNQRVGVRCDDGTVFFCDTTKLRRDQLVDLDKLMQRAYYESWRTDFCGGAWPSRSVQSRLMALKPSRDDCAMEEDLLREQGQAGY